MRTFAIAAIATSAFAALEADAAFFHYVSSHGKSYLTTAEFEARKANYLRADAIIEEINSNPESMMVAGHNPYSDYSEAEWARMRGLTDLPLMAEHGEKQGYDASMPMADTVNWVTAGHVSGVKNQGQCGSCWAFSSTGALEAANSIAGRGMTLLSEQQLVDCSRSYGNMGCSGGWYYYSYNYLQAGNSLETEDQYAYTARDGTCSYQGVGQVTASSHVSVQQDTNAIKQALNQQPVNVAVDAACSAFSYYQSGVLMTSQCSASIDHAILAVGYGVENGVEYFLVKNSWGTYWGDNGYIKMQISSGAGCAGINQYVAYPVV